jgi:hypothetical protein
MLPYRLIAGVDAVPYRRKRHCVHPAALAGTAPCFSYGTYSWCLRFWYALEEQQHMRPNTSKAPICQYKASRRVHSVRESKFEGWPTLFPKLCGILQAGRKSGSFDQNRPSPQKSRSSPRF